MRSRLPYIFIICCQCFYQCVCISSRVVPRFLTERLSELFLAELLLLRPVITLLTDDVSITVGMLLVGSMLMMLTLQKRQVFDASDLPPRRAFEQKVFPFATNADVSGAVK